MKILLAVDGSAVALRATEKLIEGAAQYRERPEVELVTVRHPVPGVAGSVVGREALDRYYREEGEKALAPSKAALDRAGLAYAPHILVGDVAPALVGHAEKTGCALIFMGTRGHSAIGGMLLGSTATKVLHLATVPVTLVR